MIGDTESAAALRDIHDQLVELFAGERIAAGILNDMVARFDPARPGAESVVARGWRSALQTNGAYAHADDAAFWSALYTQYGAVLAQLGMTATPDMFTALLQVEVPTVGWDTDDAVRIAAWCGDSDDAVVDDVPVSGGDAVPDEAVSDGTALDDAAADDAAVHDDPVATAQDDVPGAHDDTDAAHDDGDGDADTDADGSAVDDSAPAPKRTRRRKEASVSMPPRTKTASSAQTRKQRKIRQARQQDMSMKTAAEGTIAPVDVDFRLSEVYEDEVMPYVRSEVHADAAHIKGGVSGVHLYLAHRVFDLLDEGLRARGVTHTLGLGSALSALMIAVLPSREVSQLELSPMMQQAVAVLREGLESSSTEHMLDIADSLDRGVDVLRQVYAMQSKTYQEAETAARINALVLAERIGATSVVVGTTAEQLDTDDAQAGEIVRRFRGQVRDDYARAAERAARSAEFHARDK